MSSPRSVTLDKSAPAFLEGGGAATALIRARDWADHPLGPPEAWSPELRAALSLVLNSPESMLLAWGPELTFFFNDAYAPLLGPRVSWAMGAPFAEVWADAWAQAKPIIADAFAGRSLRYVDLPWKLGTDRGAADTWFTFSYSRILDAEGQVAGLFVLTNETTDLVLSRAADIRNRQILDSATEHCVIAADLDGRVTRWSEGANRVLGWSEAEMLGETVDRIFEPADVVGGIPAAAMRQALAGGRAADERWLQRKDGARFWATTEATPLRDEQGRVAGFVLVLRDRTDQRLAEQSLRETEASLRRAQEAGGVGTFWTGMDNILYPSSVFCRIYGLPERASYPTGVIEQLVVEEDRGLVSNASSRQRGEVLPAVVYRIRRGDTGELRWIERKAETERDAAGRPVRFVGVARDVTDSRRGEIRQAALLGLSDRLRDLVDADEIAFASCEVLGTTLGVSLVGYGIVDAEAETLTVGRGWSASGVQNLVGTFQFRDYGSYVEDLRRGLTVVVADAREDVRTAGKGDALAARAARSFVNMPLFERGIFVAMLYVCSAEPRIWRPDEVAFVKEVAERTRVATERARSVVEVQRQAAELAALNADLERQVRERTADRNALWQLSRDLMLRCTFEGVITATNPAWSEILGWPEQDLVGSSLFDLIHPDDMEHTIEGARSLSEGVGHARFDNRYRCRDGSYRWIAWSTRPSDGLINAVGRDVTAERDQAEALQRTEEQLRQSQKMEAVGQLTGGIAHDFNNLLTGITGSLELLTTRMTQGRLGDIERYVTAAQAAARRAAALTHRLLAFSRRQTLDPKPTDVNRLIAGMEEMIRRSVGPAVGIEAVQAVGLWPALVDQGQLENALLNLCINARDAMPDGGRITIETANRWMDRDMANAHDLPPGQYISMCVSDTGTGMPPDVIARAFDPFFTTKPTGQGTGLGLSMVYGFARQSGGHVRIYSEVGSGTNVCLYLPRHFGEAETAEGMVLPGSPPRAGQGETVLVVDDEPSVRMLVTDTLEDLGYAAIEAADGPSGLKVLQSDVRIDLLVTDVGLPGGMNGRQMVDAARVTRPDLTVLFITGYAENAVVGNGHLEPGMHVMTKPFAMDALATRIRELIAPR